MSDMHVLPVGAIPLTPTRSTFDREECDLKYVEWHPNPVMGADYPYMLLCFNKKAPKVRKPKRDLHYLYLYVGGVQMFLSGTVGAISGCTMRFDIVPVEGA